MKAVLKNGNIVDIDTKFVFADQYNTTEEHGSKRIHDIEIVKIIDDIRLTEFYCAEGIEKKGTFDEVQAAINEKRKKIEKCTAANGEKSCFWWQIDKIEKISKTTEKGENGEIIKTEKYKHIYHCGYKSKYSKDGKCEHDINPVPQLFRAANHCFFCEYPQGLPVEKNKKFIDYIVNNHRLYDIVPSWGEDIGEDNSVKYFKKFGSYTLEIDRKRKEFLLINSRNKFWFIYDFTNNKFITECGLSLRAVKTFTEDKFDYNRQKHVKKTINGFDKFIKYFNELLEGFKNNSNNI